MRTHAIVKDVWRAVILAAAIAVPNAFAAEQGGSRPEAEQARGIVKATGVEDGFVVHLGCGDGKLLMALHACGFPLVHGLDADIADVAAAREYIQSLGAYGPLAADQLDGDRLPYVDNLVNLVVAEELDPVSMNEVMRVLAPEGVAYVKRDDRWVKTVKPRSKDTDEWTHFLHDASGNAVAHDSVVGPPRRAQWIAEPRHTRSHEHIPSINALVSTGGRIFYVADEGPVASLRQPARWSLVARDAYNGVLLWKRSIPTWFPHIVNWGQTPPHLQRRLVAVGDRVYVTLGLHAPLNAVDAVTGSTLRAYEGTRGTEEIICHKGILLVLARRVTDERVAQLEKMAKLTRQGKSPLYERDTAQPVLNRFRAIERKAGKAILALDADTGRLLWKKDGANVTGLGALSLCAEGDRVFYQKGNEVVCVDLKTGRERWSASSARMRVVCARYVVCGDGKTVTALSAETGKPLWAEKPLLCNIRDAFIIDGSLWLGGFKPWQGRKKGKRGPVWGPYFVTQRDLTTGKVLKHIEPKNPGHHHRCWQNKATDRYIIGGRRGAEFIDLKSGEVLWNSWVRGVCKYGTMPCNGLLYAPPHACGCYIAAKLEGFHALAARRSQKSEVRSTKEEEDDRLIKGPAYGQINLRPSSVARRPSSDWPTYRHDVQRSGCTQTPVPAVLQRKWRADVGGKLSSLTACGGRVFVASVDEHRISALDADSGGSVWQYTAGGRVDTPPTLHEDRAIFGCRDGHVYGLSASDGKLAWRLRADGDGRRITACGQLESVSPIHGSVLIQDGTAYLTAGRSSYLDGGIGLYRINPETGEVLSRTPIYSPDPETDRQPQQHGPAYMPGALADILTSDGTCVYLRDAAFDKAGQTAPKGNPHLFALTGFLDDSWPHRSYWAFGTRCSIRTGCSGRDKGLVSGRLLVHDGSTIYGYGRKIVHWSNQLQDGPYRAFAVKRGQTKPQWEKRLPIHVRAMVLAGKVLFLAGPLADAASGTPEQPGKHPAQLIALSATDGTALSQHPLDAPPVFDAMIAAAGRLYLSLENGSLLCMAPAR